MSEIRDNGKLNPLIIVSPDEVLAWLRSKADEAGYADRELGAVQIDVKHPFSGGITYHHEVPSLVIMVSNIPNSREPTKTQNPPPG